MPQGSRRWAIIQNIPTIFVLLNLSRVLSAVTAESLSSSSTGSFRDATVPTQFMIIERQLPGNVITFQLPLPTPLPLTTNPNPLPNGTPIPLLISPFSSLSPPPSVSISRSSSSSSAVASKTSASAQSSQAGNSTTTANNANGSNKLTAINFLPFIILTSFFIIALMAWCLHGWCTRRPKEKFVSMGTMESRKKKRGGWFWNRSGGWGEENDELVCGPAYVSFVGQDVEEFATVRQSGRYRWPPLSVTNQGHQHQVSQNKHDDDGPESVPFEFAGLPVQTVRSVPSAKPRETNVGKRLMSPTTTTGPMSPTSIALRELYEVVLRNDYGSPSTGGAEERTTLLGVGSGVSSANRSTSGRKRKSHVRHGSESNDAATQLLDLGGRWGGGILSDDDSNRQKKLEVRNPSVGEGRLGLREGGLVSDGILDEEDEDSYTPLPTPTRVVHQFSFGDPPSRDQKLGGKAIQNPPNPSISLSKDVLPAHPKQIMSPPLKNQMYFVPLPTTIEPNVCVSDTRTDDGPVVGLASPPARTRGSVRPKSTVLGSREKFGERNHGVHNPSEAVDGRPTYRDLATTSPLRAVPGVKDKRRDTSSRRTGASKGKGKLVKARPAAMMSSTKNQTGGD